MAIIVGRTKTAKKLVNHYRCYYCYCYFLFRDLFSFFKKPILIGSGYSGSPSADPAAFKSQI